MSEKLVTFMALALISPAALAYIGPGAGLSAIGTVLALVGALLLTVLGFVWYPLKRLRARVRASKQDDRDVERNTSATQHRDETASDDDAEKARARAQ